MNSGTHQKDERKAFPLLKAAYQWRRSVGGPLPSTLEDHLRNIAAYTLFNAAKVSANFLILCLLLMSCGKSVYPPQVTETIEVKASYSVGNIFNGSGRAWSIQLALDKVTKEDVVYTLQLDEWNGQQFVKKDVAIPISLKEGVNSASVNYTPGPSSVSSGAVNIRVTAKGKKYLYNVKV